MNAVQSQSGHSLAKYDVKEGMAIVGIFCGYLAGCVISIFVVGVIDVQPTELRVVVIVASTIVGAVGFGTIIALTVDKPHESKPSERQATVKRQVVAGDFQWKQHRHKIMGEWKSFTISIYTDSPSILWAAKHRDENLHTGYAPNYDTALRKALQSINGKLEHDSEVNSFFRSLSDRTETYQPVSAEEMHLSRGPEVLRRYLGDGEQSRAQHQPSRTTIS